MFILIADISPQGQLSLTNPQRSFKRHSLQDLRSFLFCFAFLFLIGPSAILRQQLPDIFDLLLYYIIMVFHHNVHTPPFFSYTSTKA
ncbi:hypothetical protein BYT27DRAFT_6851630 [Phlegmacium glaucopus]|nr:hypothetical protein BYT27DRAFT_6851630 [Phlegmacium glaucopus]